LRNSKPTGRIGKPSLTLTTAAQRSKRFVP
jgi:hypothetical protein